MMKSADALPHGGDVEVAAAFDVVGTTVGPSKVVVQETTTPLMVATMVFVTSLALIWTIGLLGEYGTTPEGVTGYAVPE